MTAISGDPIISAFYSGKGIPVSMGREITPQKLMSIEEMAKDDPELLAQLQKGGKVLNERSVAERVAQLEKQDADKAHSVFRKNGKIIATIGTHTGITSTNGAGLYVRRILNEAAERGLNGSEMNDFISKEMEKYLGVPAQRFKSAAEAPTMGELHIEMFGDWRGDPMRDPRLYRPVDVLA